METPSLIPYFVDKQCPHCGYVILIRKVSLFETKSCEVEFSGTPIITCNYCGGVVGEIKCQSNEKWDKVDDKLIFD